MATKRETTKTIRAFKVDAPMKEAIVAFVREELAADGKSATLAEHVIRMLDVTGESELTADQVTMIREAVSAEVIRQRPSWAAPAGDTPEVKTERKKRAAKVRTTVHRIMGRLRRTLADAGITVPKTAQVGGRVAGKGKREDADGRTSKTEASRAAEAAVVAAGDAGAAIASLRRMIEAALKAGDYVTVIAAAERAIKVQDAE